MDQPIDNVQISMMVNRGKVEVIYDSPLCGINHRFAFDPEKMEEFCAMGIRMAQEAKAYAHIAAKMDPVRVGG